MPPSTVQGRYTPENRGRRYRSCPDNVFITGQGCPGFFWCLERPDGTEDIDHIQAYQAPLGPSPDVLPGATGPAPPNNNSSPASRIRCANCPQQRNGTCIQGFSPSTPSQSTFASTPPRSVKAYARNISDSLATKLAQGHFTVDINQNNHALLEALRKEAETVLKAYWFTEDNTPPNVLRLSIPLFPYLIPSKNETITTIVKGAKNCETYDFLDLSKHNFSSEEQEWETTNVPLKVKFNSVLCFRTYGVKICVGGPFATKKRSLAEGAESPSPFKIPCSLDLVSDDSDEENSDHGEGTSFSVPASPTKKRNKWPVKYACDMDAGFSQMQKDGGTVAEAFKAAFGKDYRFCSSTYYPNRHVWEVIPDEKLAAALRFGRGPGGEWSHLYKAYKQTYVEPNTASSTAQVALTATLPEMKKLYNAYYPSRRFKREEQITSVVEELGNKKIPVNWKYVSQRDPNNSALQVENLIITFIKTKGWTLPKDFENSDEEDQAENEFVGLEGRTSNHFSFSKWNADNLWPMIMHDAQSDDLVIVERFNLLPFHVYRTGPPEIEGISIEEADQYATESLKTDDVLRELFRIWSPSTKSKACVEAVDNFTDFVHPQRDHLKST
ncbi:hypothetical protein C8R43DRAFT_958032 [Mycena crocata]|nr:hypothetical protein C8R43DRAFT_958032 [Mycena crocata]